MPPEESAACGLGGTVFGAVPAFPLDEFGAFAPGPADLLAVEVFCVPNSAGFGGGEGLITGFGGGEGLITGLGAGGLAGMTACGTPGSTTNPMAASRASIENR